MKKIIALFLALSLLVAMSACAKAPEHDTILQQTESKNETTQVQSQSGPKTIDKFGYEEPIQITTMMLEDNIRNVPDNMDVANNPWMTLFHEYGIDVSYALSGSQDDLTTKLNMAIATNDLPDVMMATAQQFQDLSDAGLLADLTELWDIYATDETKAMFMQDGGVMMQNGLAGGKLVGHVQPTGYQDFIGIVSIRSDWLAQCGLDGPETMDELWNIAETFQEKNMDGTCTIGIGMTKNVTDLLTATLGLLNGYHAYANIWLDVDGELQNSSIQPEMKQALSCLAEKYADGLIDPEFGTKDNSQLMEDILAGRCGVLVSHFCAPFDLLNGIQSGQEWAFYAVPSSDGELKKSQFSLGFSNALCVSAKCEHPEAVIKLLNIFTEYVFKDAAKYNDNAVRNFAYPFLTAATDDNNKIYKEYLSFLETGVTPERTTQGYESTVEAAELFRNDKNTDGYTMYAVFGPDGTESIVAKAIENDAYMLDKYTGIPTESMGIYQSALNDMTVQMITDIIRGTKSIDYFDEYVATWKASGGDAITSEVNEWYAAKR